MAKVCNKVYLDTTGNEHNRYSLEADIAALQFQFATGEMISISLSDFPGAIRDAFAWHGAAAKLGDVYAGKQGVDAQEAFEDLLESLKSGQWLQKGESAGPRATDLAQALAILKPEKYPDAQAAAKAIADWTPEKKKRAAANPAVESCVLEIRTQRQKDKMAKLAESAKAASLDDL